jgi:hypothetical protein
MNEHIATYIHLRNRGKIAEEVIGRDLLTLKLKNGTTVRIPMSGTIKKVVARG